MTETNRPEAERTDSAPDQLRQMLTEEEVLALTRLSRTSLFRLQRGDKFPRGVYIAPNTKRYFRDQVIGWQKALDEHDHFNPNRGRGKGRRRRRVSSDAI